MTIEQEHSDCNVNRENAHCGFIDANEKWCPYQRERRTAKQLIACANTSLNRDGLPYSMMIRHAHGEWERRYNLSQDSYPDNCHSRNNLAVSEIDLNEKKARVVDHDKYLYDRSQPVGHLASLGAKSPPPPVPKPRTPIVR